MTIKLITFKTNHTIMAEMDNESDTGVLIKQPVQVIMQPTKEGPQLAFAPFMEYANEFKTGISIKKEDILCWATPVVELENQYRKIFGSGIEIVSSIPKM